MQNENGLKWLFLDLNSYFASVEQQENPHLRGKPVAVVPMMTDATCAIAASYEAKAYGIKTGTKIYEAKRMCPNLHCILARHDKYVEYHHKIIEEIVKHTPINKVWSIDELSSRLPPNKRSPEAVTAVVQRIKEGIWRNVGEAINCSIGVAPNSLLAKIAGEMQKPDGLVLLPQESLPGRLLDLKLTDIPGIGVNMEKRLIRAGVTSMEELWNTSPKQARRIWGSVQGERFWYWLHGYDFEQPETGNVMIGHSRMLDPNLRSPVQARLMARRLLTKASHRLRRKGYLAARVSLGARTTGGYRWRGERTLPHARDPFTFLIYLDEMWDDMMAEITSSYLGIPDLIRDPDFRQDALKRKILFKKVSVMLTDLKLAESVTGDLFETNTEDLRQTLKKREALAGALDHLQDKYQKETVWLGTTPKTLAGYVGTKIAFSRVPEKEEFWS